ncbi:MULTISPECIES: hypothetical protein [unclassified Roseobacter]|uniref:hypothetical protein n=1 Tax=unclassified Roseobacter TaxID=196798 RepID=UPI001492E9E6|nr:MULTISPECIES: hypothetical protein [unclassified Roseobacter]NNW55459.1 hypothetical protein [Roseobacter sp. HKCCD8284]NNY17300.1 hypothetical protein [Roseobacter sp. HKCCD8191]
MGLDLNTVVGRGRKPAPVTVTLVRELEAADAALLAAGAGPVSVPPPLQRITQRHHSVARLLAAGTPPGEVALITGYDNSRISILQNSPAFQELVALYKNEVDMQFSTTLENLAGLGEEAIAEIRDRLETEPGKFSLKDLRETATLALDRSGHGPSSSVKKDVTVDFSERLENSRKRALQAARGEIIEAEVVKEASE